MSRKFWTIAAVIIVTAAVGMLVFGLVSNVKAVSCTDSDAEDIYTLGTTVGQLEGAIMSQTHQDYCDGQEYVSELYCRSDGLVGIKKLACGRGYSCYQGVCKKDADTSTYVACTDTDDNNVYVKGRAKGIMRVGGNLIESDEACEADGRVKEFFCSEGYLQYFITDCPRGFSCRSGACASVNSISDSSSSGSTINVISTGSRICAETDRGNNKYLKGKNTLYNADGTFFTSAEDYCKDANTVTEVTCNGPQWDVTYEVCGEGYSCSGGACIYSATNNIAESSGSTQTTQVTENNNTTSKTVTETVTVRCYNLSGKGYLGKGWSDPKVWYVDGRYKYWFPNEEIFFSWFSDFATLKILKDSTLNTLITGSDVCLKGSATEQTVKTPTVPATSSGGGSSATEVSVPRTVEPGMSCGDSAGGDGLYSMCKGDSIHYTGGLKITNNGYTDEVLYIVASGLANTYYRVPFNGKIEVQATGSRNTYTLTYEQISSKYGAFLRIESSGATYSLADDIQPVVNISAELKYVGTQGSYAGGYSIKMTANATDNSGSISKINLYYSKVSNPSESPVWTCPKSTSPYTCIEQQGTLDYGTKYQYYAEAFDVAGNRGVSDVQTLMVPAK